MFSHDPREIILAALLWSKLLFSLKLWRKERESVEGGKWKTHITDEAGTVKMTEEGRKNFPRENNVEQRRHRT